MPVFSPSYAWPPHQIMAWVGLERYGYLEDAQRLAYRFLYMSAILMVFSLKPSILMYPKQDDDGFCGLQRSSTRKGTLLTMDLRRRNSNASFL
jgi:hypothetical protein